MPDRHLSSVLLPLPLRPTTPNVSPSATSTLTSRSAGSTSKRERANGFTTRCLIDECRSWGRRKALLTERARTAARAAGGGYACSAVTALVKGRTLASPTVAEGDTIAASVGPQAAVDLDLLFYGMPVRVHGDWPEVLDELRLDFWWFATPRGGVSAAPVEVVVERRAPDFDAFGDVPAAFVTPRNVVYQQRDRTVVDYFGRALTVVERGRDRVVVHGLDRHLVHEAVYHYVLSRVGHHLDARGTPRLHSLALSTGDGAVAVMLPSGGGKSTLAL